MPARVLLSQCLKAAQHLPKVASRYQYTVQFDEEKGCFLVPAAFASLDEALIYLCKFPVPVDILQENGEIVPAALPRILVQYESLPDQKKATDMHYFVAVNSSTGEALVSYKGMQLNFENLETFKSFLGYSQIGHWLAKATGSHSPAAPSVAVLPQAACIDLDFVDSTRKHYGAVIVRNEDGVYLTADGTVDLGKDVREAVRYVTGAVMAYDEAYQMGWAMRRRFLPLPVQDLLASADLIEVTGSVGDKKVAYLVRDIKAFVSDPTVICGKPYKLDADGVRCDIVDDGVLFECNDHSKIWLYVYKRIKT